MNHGARTPDESVRGVHPPRTHVGGDRRRVDERRRGQMALFDGPATARLGAARALLLRGLHLVGTLSLRNRVRLLTSARPGISARLGSSKDLPRSTLAGIAVGFTVLLVGVLVIGLRPVTYDAHTTLVVTPRPDLPADQVAGYYDTLSQGQIVNTLAEVLRTGGVSARAQQQAGVLSSSAPKPVVVVTAVTDTAVLTVTGRATERGAAERLADAAALAGRDDVARLRSPYELVVLDTAGGTAAREGISPVTALLMTVLVALGAGVAAQQVLSRGWRGVWSTRGPGGTVSSGTQPTDRIEGPNSHPAPRPRGADGSMTTTAPRTRT